MKNRVSKITVLISLVVCLAGLSGCDPAKSLLGKRENQSKMAARQSMDNRSLEKQTSGEQVDSSKPSKEQELADRRQALPKREYGRDNPFEPLVSSRSRGGQRKAYVQSKVAPAASGVRRDSQSTKTRQRKPEKESVFELSAILGEMAIIRVDGISKQVSAGDMVGELKALEIRSNSKEVILGKENETHTLTLGAELKIRTSKGK